MAVFNVKIKTQKLLNFKICDKEKRQFVRGNGRERKKIEKTIS